MEAVFDHLVLTASNPAQARAYRRQLAEREARGRLAGIGAWHVMEDPGGRRVGSGAATFMALRGLARGRGGAAFVRRSRVLVLHSGGDSRRLPAFAALGKAFVPMPVRDAWGRPAALLDLILADLCEAARRGLEEGEARLVVACGDVYLGMGPAGVSLSGAGIRCVAFRAPYRVAARHGVFVADGSGRVTRVLQKPGREAAAGVRHPGGFLVDSGVFSLEPEASLRVMRGLGASLDGGRAGLLERIACGAAPALDLYQDIPEAALARAGVDRLRGALRGTPLRVSVLPPRRCEFLHVGTTRELLGLPKRLAGARLPAGFARIDADGRVLRDRRERLAVGVRSIPEWLPRRAGLAVLPVGGGRWTALVFGVGDDFKATCESGGTLLGRPLWGWDDGSLWGRGAERTLWSARVWPLGSRREVLRGAAGLCAGKLPRRADRVALASVVRRVDQARLAEMLRDADRAGLLGDLRAGAAVWAMPAPTIAALAGSAAEAGRVSRAAERMARSARADARARWWGVAARVCERWASLRGRGARCGARVFESIARAETGAAMRGVGRPRAALPFGKCVVATAPARIDLAGGWSDTPPMCHRFGGRVVNMAVSLDGGHAVEVSCRRLESPELRVRSVDLGSERVIRSAAALSRFDDARDWTALARGAMVLLGWCPPRDGPTLREWLGGKGGAEVRMHSKVPKGSGLGTSSILGATIVAALARLGGRRPGLSEVMRLTSHLEQLITTGGGWQDQAGGLFPGVKVLTTRAGGAQTPRVERPRAGRFERVLADRGVLYYTGEQRLARDILRSVVGRFVDEDPAALALMADIKGEAGRLGAALRDGDAERAAGCLTRGCELKCLLDPGTITPNIRAMLGEVRPLLTGWCTPGAGGGGYVLLIARSRGARVELERRLAGRRGPAGAGVAAWGVDHIGLRVSVGSVAGASGPRRGVREAARR